MDAYDNQKNPQSSNDDMEGYYQYPGACGLTSLLMALKPKSRNINSILDALWLRIQPYFTSKERSSHEKMDTHSNEYNWQRVIEWLLFQVTFRSELQDLLTEGFGGNFKELFLPQLKYRIQQHNPDPKWRRMSPEEQWKTDIVISNDILSGGWIMDRVYEWKEDFELKIIAYLFGCEFKSWRYTRDGTGAVFFSMRDTLAKNSSIPKKIEFIESAANSGSPVLCCATIHWLAIKKIQSTNSTNSTNSSLENQTEHFNPSYLAVIYNDPASAQEHRRSLRGFRDTERFYVFEFKSQLLEKHRSLLTNL